MKLSRKEFLAGTFGVAVASLLTPGCDPDIGGDNDGGHAHDAGQDAGNASASCTQNGTAAEISLNHGHALTVSKEDVTAGTEKSYNIQGSATHPHTVVLTAAHFTQLAANEQISVESSFEGHTHSVTVSCV